MDYSQWAKHIEFLRNPPADAPIVEMTPEEQAKWDRLIEATMTAMGEKQLALLRVMDETMQLVCTANPLLEEWKGRAN